MTAYSYILVRVPEPEVYDHRNFTNAANLRKAIQRWATAGSKVGHGIVRHDRRFFPTKDGELPTSIQLSPIVAEALIERLSR